LFNISHIDISNKVDPHVWSNLGRSVLILSRGNLLRAANEPVGGTAEQLSALFRGDYEKYGRLIRELNIRTG
jgi:hypothetical protein